jgi:hypothetical protein
MLSEYNRFPKLSSSTDEQKLHPMQTLSQSKALQRDIDPQQSDLRPELPHSQFRMNERVVVYDKKATSVHGTVKEVVFAGDGLIGIGIETVRHYSQYSMII